MYMYIPMNTYFYIFRNEKKIEFSQLSFEKYHFDSPIILRIPRTTILSIILKAKRV